MKLVEHLDPDAIFISDQIGISKPNPKLYQTALRALDLTANEVMYVGDSPGHDVAPAKALGMVSVFSSRASRYDIGETDIQPDHAVADFTELREILKSQYAIL